ncbi:MAG: DUF5916 domain-containing protein [Longimicrobiales bacterium]
MRVLPEILLLAVSSWLLANPGSSSAQEQVRGTPARLSLAAGPLEGNLRIDGLLTEEAWAAAPAIERLTMIEPVEGGTATAETRVRVLAGPRNLVIGVEALDPFPAGIVSTSKARDPELRTEDYIKIVLDPFLDGRTGYIFALNPGGARYDALVARRGEGEDPQWDAVWEAATARDSDGWTAEIRIPLQSITFGGSLDRWGFNVERRVERLQEVSRWSSPFRDARIAQTSRAGLLTDLPRFDTGVGLTVRPAFVTGAKRERREDGSLGPWKGTLEPSLDVFQRLGQNATAMATVNTDFAETEVDTRKTNLTRFPLFFPEKRTFFLEGSDIFDFGIGMSSHYQSDVVPFFSRRIGLYEGETVPLQAGGKVSGRVGNTNFGGLITHTAEVGGLVGSSTMGAFRLNQNVLEESTVGVIGTFGDPTGADGSYLVGVDATYQTSRFRGNKNFLVGAWGLVTDREGLAGDKTAFGAKIDYPNDIWDVALTYLRLGDGFDPALGFVPRQGIHKLTGGLNFRHYPESLDWMRTAYYELRPTVIWSLDGDWESYRIFMAPINWRLESGDRIEANINPEGERLEEPFEISDGVIIEPGSYHYTRYRLEWAMATKRMVSGQLTWWFGDFYDGTLDQIEAQVQFRPLELFIFDLTATRNVGDLKAGNFDQQVYGLRAMVNLSPDLQLTSFVQYDDESKELGTNTRLRWTFNPLGELFVVYNYNVLDQLDRWAMEASQLLVKVQYAVRW